MGHIDYISYYTFLLHVAIAVLIAYLILIPLLGVSIYEAIANIIYRAYVPRVTTRAGDLVLGTRPIMPLGGIADLPDVPRRFPDLLPLILTPPPHLTISASIERRAILPH